MVKPQILAACVLLVPLFTVMPAQAYQFSPEEAEWQSWPGYCKAKYAWTNIGRRSRYADRVNSSHRQELQQWESSGIHGLHHYCTGSIWLQRAKFETSAYLKKAMLNNALSETTYTYDKSNRQSYNFARIVIQLSEIRSRQGERNLAIKLLLDAIQDQPQNAMLYSAAAVMQRKQGQLRDAKNTLLQGLQAVDGNSAELNYNLGLVSLELDEIDDAEKYAELAYEQGFPLPGLRKKLNKLGRM